MSLHSTEEKSFAEQGLGYQEKVIQALLEDHSYADMMVEIMKPDYFSYAHLKAIAEKFFEYKSEYKLFPSLDIVVMQISRDKEYSEDTALLSLVLTFVEKMNGSKLNGDAAWIKDDSLEFCKRGALLEAIGKVLDQVEKKKYDTIHGTMREALNKGSPKDHGHDYKESLDLRVVSSARFPIRTPWTVLDKYLNGGWERKTLSTFIAPTGAGKSMFLVNCACSALEDGLNVLYVTLEMADFKIGLRVDSWYSGVAINDVKNNKSIVEAAINERAKGRLIIKEWPTKRATVETIRAHVERLIQTKDFVPDLIVLDYADLLRPSRAYGEKRHELEGTYEELRGLAQELNCVVITADQTNRSALDSELVSVSQIGESYAKATICDLIMTVSRNVEDKINGTGRLFIAKSRLGEDGKVLPFLLQTSTVKVTLLDIDQDPLTARLQNSSIEDKKSFLQKRAAEMGMGKRKDQ